MLNPAETHGREKGFFMPRRCSSSHGLWLSASVCVSVCVSMHVGKRKIIQEWMEMSLSDSGLHMNPLQNDHIGSVCVCVFVCVEWERLSGVCRFTSTPSGAQPWLERSRTQVYISSHSYEGGRFISHTHVSHHMCVYSPPWCAWPWKPLISPILEIGAKVC